MSTEALRLWKSTSDKDLLPKSVKPHARSVLLHLAVLARQGTAYTDGNQRLARALGVSTKSIGNTLAQLEREGLISQSKAPTGPGMNRTVELCFPADLDGNAGSTLLPIQQEQGKPATETVEAHVPNGGSTRPERWKPASNYQEQSLQVSKDAASCNRHGNNIDQADPCQGCKEAKEKREVNRAGQAQADMLEAALARVPLGERHPFELDEAATRGDARPCQICAFPEANARHK